jgi:hypothetical protein
MEVVAGVVLPLPMNLLRMTSTEVLLSLVIMLVMPVTLVAVLAVLASVMMLELVPEKVVSIVGRRGNVNRIAYTRAELTSGEDITRPSAQTRPSLVNSLEPADCVDNQATEPQSAQVLHPNCAGTAMLKVRVQS